MPADLSSLAQPADSHIVLVVLDGLGGYAEGDRGSELEEASTPNLDRLAAEGMVGLHDPAGPGVTPGSGPAHLALFGYDPFEYPLGRGALSAAGLEVELKPGDVAARANLATLDSEGLVVDRRAGRIPDDEAGEVVRLLAEKVKIDGVEVTFAHEAQHRVLVVLRGDGFDPGVVDTDPQATGRPPITPAPKSDAEDPDKAQHTADVLTEFDRQVRDILADHSRANVLLLRGFDSHRELPSLGERHGLTPAAVAVYPMYRGLARLVGMDVLGPVADLEAEVSTVADNWDDYDFFFLHHKGPDSAGEDGNFEGKVEAIEVLDAAIPDLAGLDPDVLVVTGDHATPSQMAAHSWHPVPVVMWGPRVGRDPAERFGERWCLGGGLGRRPGAELMALALAGAGRLAKFGA